MQSLGTKGSAVTNRAPVEHTVVWIRIAAEIQDNGDGTWTGWIPRLGTEMVTKYSKCSLLVALQRLHKDTIG